MARTLEQEGVPTPKRARRWDRLFFRACILDDVYKPHTLEEIEAVVSWWVAARLNPGMLYGILWFTRRGLDIRQISEPYGNGRGYRKTYRWYHKLREEWIAVPDSGISRDLAEAARAAIENNRRPASAGRRFWELTGGVAFCRECGYSMCATHSIKVKKGTFMSMISNVVPTATGTARTLAQMRLGRRSKPWRDGCGRRFPATSRIPRACRTTWGAL